MAHLGARSLLLAVDGVDYTADVSNAVITAVPRPEQERLWCELDFEHGGMRDYRLALTFAQDTAEGSLWDLAWTRPSQRVTFYTAPYGNPLANADQPHWTGTAIVAGPAGDVLGGAASKSPTAVLTGEMVWVILGVPERITMGAYPADLPAGW